MVGAASESKPVLIFALVGAGVILSLLSAVIWKLINERIESSKRYQDLNERRLTAGAETMSCIRGDMQMVKDCKVDKSDCERHRKEQDHRVQTAVGEFRQTVSGLRDSLHAIETKMSELNASQTVAIKLLQARAEIGSEV